MLATKEFTVNMMSAWFVEAANHTCGPYDAGVDEFEVSGLTPIDSVAVAPPRVAESAVQFECRVKEHWTMKNAEVRSRRSCSVHGSVQRISVQCILARFQQMLTHSK